MSRGRPRHQSSRRRMYSPRQRDLRERRIHEPREESGADEAMNLDADDGAEYEAAPAWGLQLGTRASAA